MNRLFHGAFTVNLTKRYLNNIRQLSASHFIARNFDLIENKQMSTNDEECVRIYRYLRNSVKSET